jgi:hypothetical protein
MEVVERLISSFAAWLTLAALLGCGPTDAGDGQASTAEAGSSTGGVTASAGTSGTATSAGSGGATANNGGSTAGSDASSGGSSGGGGGTAVPVIDGTWVSLEVLERAFVTNTRWIFDPTGSVAIREADGSTVLSMTTEQLTVGQLETLSQLASGQELRSILADPEACPTQQMSDYSYDVKLVLDTTTLMKDVGSCLLRPDHPPALTTLQGLTNAIPPPEQR